jgi:hypothetical protein
MPKDHQAPPQKPSRFARHHSYSQTPATLFSGVSGFHLLDHSTTQLNALIDRYKAGYPADETMVRQEILKRFRGFELKTIFKRCEQVKVTNSDDKRIELYITVISHAMRRLTLDGFISSAAEHLEELSSDLESNLIRSTPTAKIIEAHLYEMKINQPGQFAELKLKCQSSEYGSINIEENKIDKLNFILTNVDAMTAQATQISSANSEVKFYPTAEVKSYYDYLSCLDCCNVPSTLLNYIYYGMFYSVDYMRRFTISCTSWSLKTHPVLKLGITALGAGTAFIGVMDALVGLGAPVFAGVAAGTTGMLIAGMVNILASLDLKDKRLSPKALSIIWLVSAYAAATSAVMASNAGTDLFTTLKYGRDVPEFPTLSHDTQTAAASLDIILALFNGFTSLRSTYGAGVRFVSDASDPKSNYHKLQKKFTTRCAMYGLMLITLAVALVYSVSITEKLTQKTFRTLVWENLTMLGVTSLANLATASIFYNRSIDWLYGMMYDKKSVSCGQWLARLITFLLVGSFYVIASYGNGKDSGEALFDSNKWANFLGGLMVGGTFASTWLSTRKIADTLVEKCSGDVAEGDEMV